MPAACKEITGITPMESHEGGLFFFTYAEAGILDMTFAGRADLGFVGFLWGLELTLSVEVYWLATAAPENPKNGNRPMLVDFYCTTCAHNPDVAVDNYFVI